MLPLVDFQSSALAGMLEQQSSTVTKLSLHQSQREQNIPTLSVLVGGAAATQYHWTQWLSDRDRASVVCCQSNPHTLFRLWVLQVAQDWDLDLLVHQRVAALTHQSADQFSDWLKNSSEYQKHIFWQEKYALSCDIPWMQWLIEHSPDLKRPLRNSSIDWPWDQMPDISHGFTAVRNLCPNQLVPRILVRLSTEERADSVTANEVQKLIQLVEAIPWLPIGLMMPFNQAEALLQGIVESKAKSMLKGGWIDVSAPDATSLKHWLGDRGINDQTQVSTVLNLVNNYGATPELLETVVEFSQLNTAAKTPETIEKYRSKAEQLLAQYLEARPSTAGRFQVNQKLDIMFGNRPMEVDFLATDTKVVIELDGYYHFQSSESYRRDRRKDILLQQQGYMVLRFLSEDVVRHLETILETVEQSLVLRQSV